MGPSLHDLVHFEVGDVLHYTGKIRSGGGSCLIKVQLIVIWSRRVLPLWWRKAILRVPGPSLQRGEYIMNVSKTRNNSLAGGMGNAVVGGGLDHVEYREIFPYTLEGTRPFLVH